MTTENTRPSSAGRQAGVEVTVAVEAMARVLRAIGLRRGVDAKQAAHTVLRALLAAGPYTLVLIDRPETIRLTPAMLDVAAQLMVEWDDPDGDSLAEIGGTYPEFLGRLFRDTLARHDPPLRVATKPAG